MFKFADPYYFFLLVPVCVGAWVIFRRRIHSGLLFSPTTRRLGGNKSWRTRMSTALPLLVLLGLVLAVAALARPRNVLSKIRRTADVIAIKMVVDVSGSMEALDMSDIVNNRIVTEQSRLDVVKETFSKFVETRPDDLIGLVTFGGFATTRCPLTTDHDALNHILSGVEIPKQKQARDGSIADQEELMTAIGDALATACARIREVEVKSRIIVLLSDGESNTGMIQPDEAIKVARKLGIKVYTIGIGSSGRAPFRGRDLFGRDRIQFAHVELDEALLKRIADDTGGQYFNVRDPKGLDRALDDISDLETTRVERDVYQQYEELFNWFLTPALLLIVIGTGLNMFTAQRIM